MLSAFIFVTIHFGCEANEMYSSNYSTLATLCYDQVYIIRRLEESLRDDRQRKVPTLSDPSLPESEHPEAKTDKISNLKRCQRALQRTLDVIHWSDRPITIATIKLTKIFKAKFIATVVTMVSAAASVLKKEINQEDN